MNARKKDKTSGFTIVELVISMVVIGILATIMFISYGGIIKKVAVENLKSDLLSATSKLAKFKATYGVYPVTISCSVPDSKTNLCIKGTTSDTAFTYNVNTAASPDAFGLTASKGNDVDLSYRTANGSEPIVCPAGYIVVPGSKTYGTSDFCVMKYEAKIKDNDEGYQTYNNSFVPESRPTGTPWVNIRQVDAIEESKTACVGCHLISEAEWMTLAQNVLGIDSNWDDDSGGHQVGVGYIYPGHSDNDPANALAISNENDGYSDTNQTSGKQRRTLTLSNGEVIWDMSGNVYEWTSGQTTGVQPGVVGAGWSLREWTAITADGTLPVDPSPKGTGIVGANLWTSSNRIGMIESSYDDIALHGMIRSGTWESPSRAGVLCLNFNVSPTSKSIKIGFRSSVSK